MEPLSIAVLGLSLCLCAACVLMFRQRKRIRRLEKQSARYHHLHRMAYTDFLTGLANRAANGEALCHLSPEDGPMCCVILDVDHLKRINDQSGHRAGDLALRQVADTLRKAFPEEEHTLFRIGGDEFAMALRLTPAETESRIAAFQALLREDCDDLSVSVGHTVLGEPGAETAQAAFDLADQRMYQNKK